VRANVRTPALTGLTAFEAVARHGSFSRAADELSVTQSAVSHRISQLESQLGVSLLMRGASAVTLTPKGRELLPFVRDGLGSLRDGVAKVSADGRPTVRLSLAPALASNWLIQRLAAFQRLHPDIHIDIHATSKNLNLRAGEADIAIRFGLGDWDGLDAVEFIPVRVLSVCSPAYAKAHPWLRQPADLARATLLCNAMAAWDDWFGRVGIALAAPRFGPSFSEVSLLIDATEFSQGVSLVFDVLVERQLREGTLVRLFGLDVPSERSYFVVTPAGVPRSDAVQAVLDWLLAMREGMGAAGADD
jgi:LysR family glycine cleavage system transcriptional activator